MSDTSGRNAFKFQYEISPITLVGGIAANFPSPYLSLLAITQASSFPQGLLASSDLEDLNDALSTWMPEAGGTLIDQAIGDYPLANQQVAANAVIEQALTISMRMIAPARQAGDFANKKAQFTALKTALDQHNLAGGLYNVLTPAYLYENCILVKMTDVTPGGPQAQSQWRFDFTQPLVTLKAAQAAQNSLMQRFTNGSPVIQPADGSSITPSSLSSSIGNSVGPGIGGVVPSAQNIGGAGVISPSIFSTGIVGSGTPAVVNSTSAALASFGESKEVVSAAMFASSSVGSSIAGGALTAARSALSLAQTAALFAPNPTRGLISAQFSSIAAVGSVTAATQALQRGIGAGVGSSGIGSLQTLLSVATRASVSAQAAVSQARLL